MTFPFPVFCPSSGVGPVTALSFHGRTSVNSHIVSLPNGTLAGDLAIFHNSTGTEGGSPPSGVPSGFTQGINFTFLGGPGRTVVSYGVLQASDISTGSVTGVAGSFGATCTLLIFRPNGLITSATHGSPNSQDTTGNPASQTITSGSGSAPLVVFGEAQGSTSFTPTGTLVSTGTQITGLPPAGSLIVGVQRMYYHIYNSSPANLTWDMPDTGSVNAICSFYVQVS